MKGDEKCKNWGGLGGKGYPRSSETSPFDKIAYDFLFNFNTNYVSILYRFRVVARFSSKVANFNPPHLHLSLPEWVIPFKFHPELWCQNTRVLWLSCGIIRVILRLAALIQYWNVTDTHTQADGQTHDDGIYHA